MKDFRPRAPKSRLFKLRTGQYARSQLCTRSCDFNVHLTFHGLLRAMNMSLYYDVRNIAAEELQLSLGAISVHLLSLAPAFSLFSLIIRECVVLVVQYRGAIHVCADAVMTQSHAWKPAFALGLQSYFPWQQYVCHATLIWKSIHDVWHFSAIDEFAVHLSQLIQPSMGTFA